MPHGVRVNVGNDEQPAGLFEPPTHLHSEAFMENTQKLIEQAYFAFNNRDIDSCAPQLFDDVVTRSFVKLHGKQYVMIERWRRSQGF
jgi:hypothetical protein